LVADVCWDHVFVDHVPEVSGQRKEVEDVPTVLVGGRCGIGSGAENDACTIAEACEVEIDVDDLFEEKLALTII
jgi:hypothetical protein